MKPAKVDYLLGNARIHTLDPAATVAEAMAVAGGRVAAVGPARELLERWAPDRVLDGQGACVYPGFLDPHSHLLNYGLTLGMADLKGTRSWGETVARVRAHQARHPSPWIRGRGWDQNAWPGQAFPTREELDLAFPRTSVFLLRVDANAALVNGAALALAGVDERTRVDGGILVQEHGRLTGLLLNRAIDLVRRVIPAPDRASRERALLAAQDHCFQAGLTTVSDAGTDLEDALLMDALQREGRLKLRVYAMLKATEANFAHFLARGIHVTERMTIRSVKVFADGALGSRGALLLEPYQDDPGSRGLQLVSEPELEAVCRRAAAAGYQVNTHCIGDAAVRLTLGAYARHLEPGNDLRWRIEHAQIIQDQDLPRFGALGVIPSIQAAHATSDMAWAARRLGPRIRIAYRYQELLRQNGWLANGSDFPVEPVNPLFGFYAAVARKDRSGSPEGGFQTEDALTREQALRAMTIWAARANFQEHDRGSLEPGKWADFVALDRDLLAAPEADLLSARVTATFVAGEQVHGGMF
ncbi:MAG: amidohydrolase [Holophaga sp.]|jgi:hypothetical protein